MWGEMQTYAHVRVNKYLCVYMYVYTCMCMYVYSACWSDSYSSVNNILSPNTPNILRAKIWGKINFFRSISSFIKYQLFRVLLKLDYEAQISLDLKI